jgi:4-aminobutyrate aminotransferase/(S)-3-amino-2-methylpropionate transaminase
MLGWCKLDVIETYKMSQNIELRKRHLNAVAKGVGTKTFYAHHAEGSELWDVEGNRYIDFAAGIAVLNTGHRHPRVMSAVANQAECFTHTCFHVVPFEGYVRLAERLNTIAPVTGPAKTMLVNSGAEAVENAIKIARVATGRSAVIAFTGAFHGRTMMGMALTGKVQPYKKGFGPFPSEIYHAAYPNLYHGGSTESAIAGLRQLFAADVDPARVAAIVFEAVQGEGGFVPAPPEFLQALREFADEHDILLIADEVQTGMARTGKMFCIEHASIKADIVTMAKGLAGGFPLSAVVGRSDVMDAAHVGGLGGTYAGNPLAVAAANAVLDVIEEENLCARAGEMGKKITKVINAVASQPGMEAIGDVRGPGAMVAFELVRDRNTRAPDADLANAIVAEAEQRGLILLVCGIHANVVRLLPPLTTSKQILNEALEILKTSITAAINSRALSEA